MSGLHHPDTFNCLTSLVALLRGAGKASQALPLAQRCLAVKKKSLGELHPDTAASMQVVADVMLDLGRCVLPCRGLGVGGLGVGWCGCWALSPGHCCLHASGG